MVSGMTKSRGINRPKAAWTQDQVEALRALYPNFKTADIALLIGHELQATCRKANSLV